MKNSLSMQILLVPLFKSRDFKTFASDTKPFFQIIISAVVALAFIGTSFAACVGDVLSTRKEAATNSLKVTVGDDVEKVNLEFRKTSKVPWSYAPASPRRHPRPHRFRKTSKVPWSYAASKTNALGSREVVLQIPANLRSSEIRVVVSKTRPVPATLNFTKSADASSVSLAQTPSGKRVAMEAYDSSSKLWKRISLAEASKPGGDLKISVPKENRNSELRVVALDASKPSTISAKFPDRFRKGKTSFEGPEEKQNSGPEIYSDRVFISALSTSQDKAKTADTNSVEEADIWRVLGKRLYFFNQLRGLQVIDTSNAASPEIISTLRMPAVGEDMYVLSENKVLLVRRDYSGEWKTFVLLIDCSSPSATILKKLELPGWYSDSRMVNGRLVIATSSWNWNAYTQTGTLSVVEDVATTPRVAASREFDNNLSTMGVCSDYLWVAGSSWQNWNKSSLSLFPIDKLPSLSSPLPVSVQGSIQDKFKVHQNGNALFAITQSWGSNWRGVTKLESFIIADGSATPAATLQLVEGETLHATRFDGDKAYAVTFRNVDPLWIIDISDANDPRIVSELQVPGWSSYIQPVGNCLAAVGVEGAKVVASLFDVSDPANPSLASRIEAGGNNEWTWSEANWNEKAVAILPDQNLILLPYQSWNRGTGTDSAVQIIDLDAGSKSLTKRGVIQHAFQPRRATALEQGILASISNRELLLLDASDRDRPLVLSDSSLAFGADRILFADDKIIVHAENAGWGLDHASLRVSDATDPESILAEAFLPCDRILGGGVNGDKFAIAVQNSKTPDKSGFFVYQFDALPALVEVGRTEADFSAVSSFGCQTKLIWPTNDLAVLSSVSSDSYFIGPPYLRSDAEIVPFGICRAWSSWNEVLKLHPFDLSGKLPKACPAFELPAPNLKNFSDPFAADGLVVFSAQKSKEITPQKIAGINRFELIKTTFLPRTRLNSYLWVVDFADPETPRLWPQTTIPGKLEGIADFDRSAGLIITSQSKVDSSGETISALLYESSVASLVSSFDLKPGQPIAVSGRWVYSADANTIALRSLENTGSFSLKGSVTNLPWNPLELRAAGGFLEFRQGQEVGLVDSLLSGDISTWTLDSWFFWKLDDTQLIGDSIAIPLGDFGLEILK